TSAPKTKGPPARVAPRAQRQQVLRLQLRAQLHRIRASIIDHVQQLVAEAAGGVVLGVGEVQCLEEYPQVVVEVVARAEVDFRRRLEEGRLGAELRAVLLLTE